MWYELSLSVSLSERISFHKTFQEGEDVVLPLLNNMSYLWQWFNPLAHFHARSKVQVKISFLLHWLLIFCAHSLATTAHLESSETDIKSSKVKGTRSTRLLQKSHSSRPRLPTALPPRLVGVEKTVMIQSTNWDCLLLAARVSKDGN